MTQRDPEYLKDQHTVEQHQSQVKLCGFEQALADHEGEAARAQNDAVEALTEAHQEQATYPGSG
jgi:hypothetical protein